MDAPQATDANSPHECGFRLDALEVDPLEGFVSGPGGREKLDPKVMAVLVLMTSQSGQIASRDELLARLLPNRVVTEDAVTRCFSMLRRQLGQAGDDQRYRAMIETLPKRGYRLNGEIAWLRSQPAVGSIKPGSHSSFAIAVTIGAAIVLGVTVGLVTA